MNKFTLRKNGKTIAEDVVELTLNTPKYLENNKKFDYEELNGDEKIITFEGIQIFFGELVTKGLIDFDVTYKNPFVLVTFEIEGGHGFTSKNAKKALLEIPENTCNCVFFPILKGSMFYTSEKRKYVTFLLSEDFIIKLFSFHFPTISKPYIDLILENKQFNLFSESKQIPYAIHTILGEIINCYHKDELKEAFLKTKITEIFVELFALLEEKKQESKSKNDILAEKTKEFISENFATKISLDEIAKELTTNKTKLKTVFKNQFGTSIFVFKKRIQMEEAQKLLDSKNITVSEVAYAVGYKNPQHFTTAFKKYFGVTPTKYKLLYFI